MIKLFRYQIKVLKVTNCKNVKRTVILCSASNIIETIITLPYARKGELIFFTAGHHILKQLWLES